MNGKHFKHEYRLVMPDNSVKYFHVVAHALSDKSGRIDYVAAVKDVTERKGAEEALREAQTNLARQPRDHHGRADCLPGARDQVTDFRGGHQRP